MSAHGAFGQMKEAVNCADLLLRRGFETRRVQPFVDVGGHIGFAGRIQKAFTLLAWGQLTCLFPRKPTFLDEPFA
ncbi:hypothetical protein MA20_46900 [Bradyrhizobium japonicum]|uniref:Uncharacterized protein n=1 Tax=Bradyrhizobium japonicum TaxID=375 RepID=A0A0A3YH86_BRAJP|nr:hypothetical protein MA20_46900 [Bradyrhizobium japonicum]